MFTSSVIALALAGMPAQSAKCVSPAPAGAVAKGKAWYIANAVVAFGGKSWVKYGLPRVLMPGEVEQIGTYKGAAVYKEAGAAEYEVIYVLADLADCSFQPYQVKA
jgi:hypothetical protein